MIRDAGEDIFQPDEGVGADALTGTHETPQHRSGLAAFVAPKENPVVATYGYHASILLISDRKLKFTIVDTRFTADDCGCSTVNSALAAGSSMSKWPPAP